jgi:hypothetical protein
VTGATYAVDDLRHLLARFRDRYPGLQVIARPVDLTGCFWSDEAQRHVAPRSYGPLPVARVLGYVVMGGAFVRKFAKDDQGRVLRDDGIPRMTDFRLEQETMSCLCVHDMRNTSLYEIADALEGTHKIQGYRRWHLRTITEELRRAQPAFDPQRDSCFLFAGPPDLLRDRIALNAVWLQDIVQLGADGADAMSFAQADLMARVFPPDVLDGQPDAIRDRSYMWGRDIWQPASATFLHAKVTARQALLAQRSRAI